MGEAPRARRRREMANMKARVRRYVRFHEYRFDGVARTVDDREAGRLATDHYVSCSCPLCGNHRRHFGPKHSELRRMPIDAEETPDVRTHTQKA